MELSGVSPVWPAAAARDAAVASGPTTEPLAFSASPSPAAPPAAPLAHSGRRSALCLPPPVPCPASPSMPQHILLIYNISKSSNVGPLLRTAVAFSCSAVAVVGGRKLSMHGNQHTTRFLHFLRYDDIATAASHLKSQGFTLLGIEIAEAATELSSCAPFPHRCCFIPGNESSGLSAAVLPHLDGLLYIRQSGCGTASLNVATAVGIVLYSFQQWADFPQQSRQGAKYAVDEHRALAWRGFRLPRGEKWRAGEEQEEPLGQQPQAPLDGQRASRRPAETADDASARPRESSTPAAVASAAVSLWKRASA